MSVSKIRSSISISLLSRMFREDLPCTANWTWRVTKQNLTLGNFESVLRNASYFHVFLWCDSVQVVYQVKLLPVTPAFHLDISSCPGCSTTDPVSECTWQSSRRGPSACAVALTWETWMGRFWLLALAWTSLSWCGHLRSIRQMEDLSLSLFLILSPYLSFFLSSVLSNQ